MNNNTNARNYQFETRGKNREYTPLDSFTITVDYVDMATAERIFEKERKTVIKAIENGQLDAKRNAKGGYDKPWRISTASLFRAQYGMSRGEYIAARFLEIEELRRKMGGSYSACAKALGFSNMLEYCKERDQEEAERGGNESED